MSETTNREDVSDWRQYPRYIADVHGLFVSPIRLVCCACHSRDRELFYGHCRTCAEAKNIPRQVADPQKFHDAVKKGSCVIIDGIPKEAYYPWRHWRRRFQ